MTDLLAYRTWHTVRAAALAHGLGFDTNQTRAQGCQRLTAALLREGRLRRAFRALSTEDHEALVGLQAAGGSLPLHEFTARFGQIRRYRPWRSDSPRHPWRYPISAAEKLWHLAFVEIARKPVATVLLTDAAAALLPPLPRPIPLPIEARGVQPASRALFIRDLAAFLAYLRAGQARWIHGRWLSSRSLRQINARLAVPESLDGARGERQSSYIRFLHYVAHVAGLIDDTQLPTPKAWLWLSAPSRWDSLWDAVTRDLGTRHPLWENYGLPLISEQEWIALGDSLRALQPGHGYALDSLCASLRFKVAPKRSQLLLTTVLKWMGRVAVDGNRLILIPGVDQPEQHARLALREDALDVDLPLLPRLRPYVEISEWSAVVSRASLRIDGDAVRRALQAGYDTGQIITRLAEISGAALPFPIVEKIRQWGKRAERLSLRPLLVLTARDAADLAALRADWRLRPLFGELLSSHHVIVKDSSRAFRRKLQRRGYAIREDNPPAASLDSPSALAYLYLAARAYQLLGALAPPDVRIPASALAALGQQLGEHERETLNQAAAAYTQQLRQLLVGKQVAQGGVAQTDPDGIRMAVQQAQERRQALTVSYYSPASGEETIRVIEPIMLYERNGTEYVEAWCRREEDHRTFRIDRIICILPDGGLSNALP